MAIAMKDGKLYMLRDGTYYRRETAPEVATALESARQQHKRVRIFYGYTEFSYFDSNEYPRIIGEAWPEENDVSGYVGRTTGPVKTPILVYNSRSTGGIPIETRNIVGIQQGKKWLYKHGRFNVGLWGVVGSEKPPYPYYPFEVFHNGKMHARFRTLAKAERYMAFMQGLRGSK